MLGNLRRARGSDFGDYSLGRKKRNGSVSDAAMKALRFQGVPLGHSMPYDAIAVIPPP